MSYREQSWWDEHYAELARRTKIDPRAARTIPKLARWLKVDQIRVRNALLWTLDHFGPPPKLTKAALAEQRRRLRDLGTGPKPKGRGRPRREIDSEHVRDALARTKGSIRAAAKLLDVPHRTLADYLERDQGQRLLWQYGPTLETVHARLLEMLGISPPVAARRGYASVHRRGRLYGLQIPIWNVRGGEEWEQMRREDRSDSRRRYENSDKARPTVDLNPAGRALVLDFDRPLFVCESPRKADACISRGVAAVAVQGVRMVSTDAAEWKYLGVSGRAVEIVFDSDVATNPEVGAAEYDLAKFLEGLGARVTCRRLPNPAQKVGVDYYLMGESGDALTALLALPAAAPSPWKKWRKRQRGSRGW